MKEEKPTRKERLKAYEFAREWLNDSMNDKLGICTLLNYAISPIYFDIKDFTELIEIKPKDKGVNGYWFSSAKERIQVLTKIINKMKEEPLIKPGQQFKIDSIEELKEAYEKLSPWIYSLKLEIGVFNSRKYNYVIFDKGHEALLLFKSQEDYETIPNPLKKVDAGTSYNDLDSHREKPEPISTAMNNIYEACRSAKTLIEVAEMAKERNELREELKALREDVEKLKGEKEEKPKESEELKMKHPSCELTLKGMGDYAHLVLKTTTNECHFFTEKEEAIKIVNYLKKHFEI